MRRTIAAAPLVLAFALLVASPSAAYAASYLDEAVQALQTGNVYVSVETQTINTATKERLIQQTQGTDIGVVILPEGARTEAGDLPQFVSRIAFESNKETVVVAIGNDLEASGGGAASKLANDLERSNSSTGEALVKFITETQTAPATESTKTDPGSDSSGVIMPLVLGIAVIAVGITVWLRRKRKPHSDTTNVQQSIPELLTEMSRYTVKCTDPSKADAYSILDNGMRETLVKAISNTNALFSRLDKTNPALIEETTKRYAEMLARINSTLHFYVDFQNNEDFYRDKSSDPEGRERFLQKGKTAVSQYSEGVLNNIRENSTGTMRQFHVDTSLIEQRFGPEDPWKNVGDELR